MAPEKPVAEWSLSLDVTCPRCGEYFDIIAHDCEFFIDGAMEPLENDTPRSSDYEVTCPTCDEEFKCDFSW